MFTYGTEPTEIPEGFVAKIRFPELFRIGERTKDGRLLEEGGFTEPRLPIPIMSLRETGPGGHQGAVVAGRLDFIEVSTDGIVSGVGFARDDEDGRRMAADIKTGANAGNSVDLRDVELRVKFPSWEEYDNEDEEGFTRIPKVQVNFTEYTLGATTIVPVPAFKHAHAEIEEGTFELTASLAGWSIDESNLAIPTDDVVAEMVASGASVSPWDDFHTPEPDHHQKVIVDADNRVYGHLGTWDSCHTGIVGRCATIPRSRTNYASFNKPGVLTERGMVSTGPLFLAGGHVKSIRGLTPDEINEAYGGVENTWADVRVVDGRFGPWISGRVRPGVPPEKVYAARASRLSGHWLADELYAVVCVNAEGFNVTRHDEEYAASFDNDGRLTELVASFAMGDCGCDGAPTGPSDEEVALALIELDA